MESHSHTVESHSHAAGDHSHAVEDHSHAGQGPVVLDIGGDVGALVVSMPPAMEGLEVEIRPAEVAMSAPAPHVAVIGRPSHAGVSHTLVFPALQQGAYKLNQRQHETVAMTVDVYGGSVTQAEWPALEPARRRF